MPAARSVADVRRHLRLAGQLVQLRHRAARGATAVEEELTSGPHAIWRSAHHSVSRITLHQVLSAGLDGVLHHGKEFERYSRADDGTVTLHFVDGTTAPPTCWSPPTAPPRVCAASTFRMPTGRHRRPHDRGQAPADRGVQAVVADPAPRGTEQHHPAGRLRHVRRPARARRRHVVRARHRRQRRDATPRRRVVRQHRRLRHVGLCRRPHATRVRGRRTVRNGRCTRCGTWWPADRGLAPVLRRLVAESPETHVPAADPDVGADPSSRRRRTSPSSATRSTA